MRVEIFFATEPDGEGHEHETVRIRLDPMDSKDVDTLKKMFALAAQGALLFVDKLESPEEHFQRTAGKLADSIKELAQSKDPAV